MQVRTTTEPKTKSELKEKVQRFGRFLSGMVMPNIGAFIAWGLIMALSIPTGWIPNENLAKLVGPMIMGPLGGFVIVKFDKYIDGKIPAGFEMLINNFSAGIIGMLLALLAFLGIGPLVLGLTNILKVGLGAIVDAGLLPLTSIFIEPAKILFLNNAINHGILGPIGIQEAKEVGKSVIFRLEKLHTTRYLVNMSIIWE